MSQPLDHFNYEGGRLSASGVSLEKIADEIGTPCYVYSAEAFLEPLRALQKGLKGLDHLVCFAVKSNSNVAVLKLLHEAGAGVDIVSGGELYRAGLAGVAPSKIVFSGVGKTPGELINAMDFAGEGILSFNVESVAELAMLSALAEEMGRVANVALRFNPDVDAKTHPYISTGLKRDKFGMNRGEILKVAAAWESFPGIAFKGVSIHIGSQILSLSPLNDAFGRVKSLIAELDALLPEPVSYVDLGGGLGISYKDEKPQPIAKYCALIRRHFAPKRGERGLRVLLEPGRALSGNSGALLTEVLYRKTRKEKDFLIIDAAMNDLIRPSLYESYHEVVPVRKTASRKLKKTDVVGPVCESGDRLASDRKLPEDLDQGDLLAILSAGAYGFVMASNYNSRPRPPEVLVQGGDFRVIREREEYADLVRGEKWD